MYFDIKQQWVDALRSGDYQQGVRRLRTEDDEFCCLGVLCDIAVKNNVIPQPFLHKDPQPFLHKEVGVYAYQGVTGYLPSSVVQWAGLEKEHPTFLNVLIRLNDNGVSFDEISKKIDEEL